MSAERSIREHQREASAAVSIFSGELQRRRLLQEGWSEECLESERRFVQRVARLYPLIGAENGVRVPEGIGTLLTAFSDGCQVLLMKTRATATDLSGKSYRPMTVFDPEDVKPYGRGEARS